MRCGLLLLLTNYVVVHIHVFITSANTRMNDLLGERAKPGFAVFCVHTVFNVYTIVVPSDHGVSIWPTG